MFQFYISIIFVADIVPSMGLQAMLDIGKSGMNVDREVVEQSTDD